MTLKLGLLRNPNKRPSSLLVDRSFIIGSLIIVYRSHAITSHSHHLVRSQDSYCTRNHHFKHHKGLVLEICTLSM